MPRSPESKPPDTNQQGPYEVWLQEIKRRPPRIPKDAPERPIATPELKERMDRELATVGDLMEKSGVWWQLDGALNISLYKGEYIGAHADVDISILRRDVPFLEKYLAGRGYGLFLVKKEGEKRIYRRVGARAFSRKDWDWQLRFAAVNDKGEILENTDQPFIEVSVIEQTEQGDPLTWTGALMPKRWLEGRTIEFRSTHINLSNPARLLFNKIWFTRPYDENDLEELVKSKTISLEDAEEVAALMAPTLREFENDPEIGKEHADYLRERIRRIKERVAQG